MSTEISAAVEGRVERDLDLDPPLRAEDRHALMGHDCVPTVKIRMASAANSSSALARRSVSNFGSQSIVATTRRGSAPKMKRAVMMA